MSKSLKLKLIRNLAPSSKQLSIPSRLLPALQELNKSVFVDTNVANIGHGSALSSTVPSDITNVAYVFSNHTCIVNIISADGQVAVMDIFGKGNGPLKLWTYQGRVVVHVGNNKYDITPGVYGTENADILTPLRQIVESAVNAVLTLPRHKYALQETVNKRDLAGISIARRDTYHNYTIANYDQYNGPYKFIKGSVGLEDLDDAKLIRYTYEGTSVKFTEQMFDEVPFSNYLLEVTLDKEVNYLQYVDGVIKVLKITELGILKPLMDIDTRKYKVGDYISVLNSRINAWIGAYTEFMYKFNMLAPYSVIRDGESKEKHTSRVVNETSVYSIVQLGAERTQSKSSKGGTHASPGEHTRIGHKRVYKKTGKEIWIDEITVNVGVPKKIHKEYRMSP